MEMKAIERGYTDKLREEMTRKLKLKDTELIWLKLKIFLDLLKTISLLFVIWIKGD